MAFEPFTQREWPGGEPAQYETISFLNEYSNLSLEELRLEDYQQGRSGDLRMNNGGSAMFSLAAPRKAPGFNHMTTEEHLELLRGPGIEICVGVSSSGAPPSTYDTWCLPRRLISHFSPFLKAAHEREFKERQENRIKLPDDDATVFGLFVQWIYYGEYTTSSSFVQSKESSDSTNIHLRCWVLGDKLLCADFKNHAMSRLYLQHTAGPFYKLVTTQDVNYACENSPTDSKLRKFYFAFVIEHFSCPDRLQGSTEEWDDLLVAHDDLRLLFVQNLRMVTKERTTVGKEIEYFDEKCLSL